MDNFRPDQKWLKDYLEKAQKEFEYRYEKPQAAQDSIRNYTLIRTLGCGSFGRVMLAKPGSTDYNLPVIAIKILIKEKIIKMKQVEHTINEKRILYAIGSSPFIVHCLRAFKDTTNLYMVMNFVNGGELFLYLRRKGRLPERDSRFYTAQVTLALQYLHNCNVIYRDLKPENILLDHKGYLKMTDFGFAKRTTSHSWTLCGTPQYLAPEMIHNKAYNKSVDYWGLGILVYELCAGYPPFEHKVPIKLYEKICEGHVDYPSHFSTELVHLVKNLLQLDVTKRFGNMKHGAMDIINHPWFKDTDFRKIMEKHVTPPWEPNLSGPMDVSNFEKFNEEVISISKTDKYPEEFSNF